jgi:hypothetical protein
MSERSDNIVRLGCAEQAAIADELRRYWQHVVDEGVPEQLRGLVERAATMPPPVPPLPKPLKTRLSAGLSCLPTFAVAIAKTRRNFN